MGAAAIPDTRETQELLDSDLTASFRVSVRATGEPDEAQLGLIKAKYLDPAALEEHPPYVVHAEVSNNQRDSYWTRMHMSSLKNYEADAKDGVAFMNSHRTGGFTPAEQPYGQSFDARLSGAQGNGIARLDEWFYIPAGTFPNGQSAMSADDMIRAIRTGSGRDISIGFYGARWMCSVCNRDMMRDWDCRHFPGMTYKLVDSKGNETGEEDVAFAWIHDAHQTEASLVYDGATPGCMTKKAKRMAAAGELRPEAIDLIEARYRIALPHPARRSPGVEVPTQEGHMHGDPTKEDEQQRTNPPAPQVDHLIGIRTALESRGVKPDASPAEVELAVRQLLQDGQRAMEFATDENRALAEQGRQYREDLITAALEEGARALGKDNFSEDTYRPLLTGAKLDQIKRMRDDWKATADKAIPTGRITETEEEVKVEAPATNGRRPDAAYRA